MKTQVATTKGPPYELERRGHLYSLSRKIGNHNSRIMFSRNDLINVCNGLIDLIESAS